MGTFRGRWLVAALLAALGIVTMARVMAAPNLPRSDPDLEGVVVSVLDSGRALLVQTDDSDQPDYRVALTRRTHIFRQTAAGEPEPVDAGALAPGLRVHIWLTGPVAESFPAQAAARAVLLVE